MACVKKCDVCGRIEYDVSILNYVDEPVIFGLLKDWHLSLPLEDICEGCVKRINEYFDENVFKVRNNNVLLTDYGRAINN